MNNNLLRAAELVDHALSQPDGDDVFFYATIYYALKNCELNDLLSKTELLTLTDRLRDAAGTSTVPLLTAERADAVRFLLEYGITETMSPELTSLSATHTRTLLLTCDMDTFTDLVDAVALDSQEYYAPDYGAIDDKLISRLNRTIQNTRLQAENAKPALDCMLSSAARKEQAQPIVTDPEKAIPPQRS